MGPRGPTPLPLGCGDEGSAPLVPSDPFFHTVNMFIGEVVSRSHAPSVTT
jgi:hypothetical protein